MIITIFPETRIVLFLQCRLAILPYCHIPVCSWQLLSFTCHFLLGVLISNRANRGNDRKGPRRDEGRSSVCPLRVKFVNRTSISTRRFIKSANLFSSCRQECCHSHDDVGQMRRLATGERIINRNFNAAQSICASLTLILTNCLTHQLKSGRFFLPSTRMDSNNQPCQRICSLLWQSFRYTDLTNVVFCFSLQPEFSDFIRHSF